MVNEEEIQEKWNHVRPFIRYAYKATQDAFFNNAISSKKPRLMYIEGKQLDKEEYLAWDKFYKTAWNDFKDLDSKLMKLQKTKGTNLPKSPDVHNFTLKSIG